MHKIIYIQITSALILAPKTIGPKRAYLAHPERFFSESKGDPLWKHCFERKGIGLTTQKLSGMDEPYNMVSPLSIPWSHIHSFQRRENE